MAKVQRMTISEFLNGDYKKAKPTWKKITDHVVKYRMVYEIAGMTVVILFVGADFSFAESTFADGEDFDSKLHKIYDKLAGIGKWVIIIKGAIEIIQMISNGELDGIKKKVISYLLVYAALLALPWGMDQVDDLF